MEGGLLDQLGELGGHLIDGADDSEVVVRVVEGPQDPVEDVLKLQSLPPAGAVARKERKRGWATTSAREGGILKLAVRLT